MVPPQFTNFFIASSSAGGALVGLLFVAVSIAPERIVMANAPVERRAMAASSFTALLNAFFISLGALIPWNVSSLILLMSAFGLSNSLFLAWNLLKDRQGWQNVLRRIVLILASFVIYGYELYIAIHLLYQPNNLGSFYTLTGLLLTVYGIGLVRAWQLLGARRYGLMRWLNPLTEMNGTMPITNDVESRRSSKTAHDEN
jgi:hypothetical protein